ncbi:MAG: hypothetical protein INQ03_00590 [Candidatus Heimdallarchaeota archaeon]|nr:hypothetical protein [Candidatus Heimdallarchaeota archaeon]
MTEDIKENPITILQNYNLLLETMKIRRSIRNFDDQPLKKQHIDLIEAYLGKEELLIGPLGRGFRIELVIDDELNSKNITTYGYTKNAQAYLLGIATKDKYNLFEVAYVFQGLILYLTIHQIATCWLGGIFHYDQAASHVKLEEEEIIPAISPIGYPGHGPHFFSMVAKRGLKPHKRRPVHTFTWLGDFSTPFKEETDPLLYNALYYGSLAPNAQNKQSWRVLVSKDCKMVHFYVKFKLNGQVHDGFRGYAVPPEYLDIGIFYRHFETFLKSQGIMGQLKLADPGYSDFPEEKMEYIASWTMSI